jgi:GNAT superfamily N-acetyltransferase
MKTTHRNYADEQGDFNRICLFFIDHPAETRQYSTWCLGRFVDWKYGLWGGKLDTPGFWNKNAHLWFDGFGKLAGFVISEGGGSQFDVVTTAGYRFLFGEMLAWALENWGERPLPLSIEINAAQTTEIKILEQNGFTFDATFFTSHFDLTRELPAPFPLETGFTVVDMHNHPDYRGQRLLRSNAFQGKSDIEEEELKRLTILYTYSHEGPIYHPQTDLCVMAADGQLVSGCEALIDAHNAQADIERVCTHSDFRRRGFARVVIQACLSRLREMGIQEAFITGYSEEAINLYNLLGAVKRTESLIYKKN